MLTKWFDFDIKQFNNEQAKNFPIRKRTVACKQYHHIIGEECEYSDIARVTQNNVQDIKKGLTES